jgi:hypothetical protein
MLQTCLKINRSYSVAREAIKKLQNPNQGDWYQWWFSHSKYKKIFGGTLAGMILATVTIILLLTLQGKADMIAVLVTLTAILIGLLLSPSLKRIKLADIELGIALCCFVYDFFSNRNSSSINLKNSSHNIKCYCDLYSHFYI